MTAVNTTFNGLLNTQGFEDLDFSNVRLSLAGMAMQAVADQWKEVTGHLYRSIRLTETSPAACINPMTLKSFNGTVGLPISSTFVSIKDDDGKDLSFNEDGEICISRH